MALSSFLKLTIPAASEHLKVLRTTLAAVAAGMGMTIDQVEDVRLAVEEAAARLLQADPPQVVAEVAEAAAPLTIELRAAAKGPVALESGSFSRMILDALTDELTLGLGADQVTITLRFAPAPVADQASGLVR